MSEAAGEIRSYNRWNITLNSKHKTLGLVGLGLMGSALAERFLRAGYRVVGFDVNPGRRRAFKRVGGEPVNSAREVAARCNRIVLSLPTTKVVESVFREIGDGLRAGTIIIDTTTGEPGQTAALGAKLARRRVQYLDATIVGSSAQTREGNVTALVGGSRRMFAACGEVFRCFAEKTF